MFFCRSRLNFELCRYKCSNEIYCNDNSNYLMHSRTRQGAPPPPPPPPPPEFSSGHIPGEKKKKEVLIIFGEKHLILGQALEKIFGQEVRSQKSVLPPPPPQTKLVPYAFADEPTAFLDCRNIGVTYGTSFVRDGGGGGGLKVLGKSVGG